MRRESLHEEMEASADFWYDDLMCVKSLDWSQEEIIPPGSYASNVWSVSQIYVLEVIVWKEFWKKGHGVEGISRFIGLCHIP